MCNLFQGSTTLRFFLHNILWSPLRFNNQIQLLRSLSANPPALPMQLLSQTLPHKHPIVPSRLTNPYFVFYFPYCIKDWGHLHPISPYLSTHRPKWRQLFRYWEIQGSVPCPEKIFGTQNIFTKHQTTQRHHLPPPVNTSFSLIILQCLSDWKTLGWGWPDCWLQGHLQSLGTGELAHVDGWIGCSQHWCGLWSMCQVAAEPVEQGMLLRKTLGLFDGGTVPSWWDGFGYAWGSWLGMEEGQRKGRGE